jgi:hypothetical protein
LFNKTIRLREICLIVIYLDSMRLDPSIPRTHLAIPNSKSQSLVSDKKIKNILASRCQREPHRQRRGKAWAPFPCRRAGIWLPASSTRELEGRDLIGWAQARPKRGEWETCFFPVCSVAPEALSCPSSQFLRDACARCLPVCSRASHQPWRLLELTLVCSTIDLPQLQPPYPNQPGERALVESVCCPSPGLVCQIRSQELLPIGLHWHPWITTY